MLNGKDVIILFNSWIDKKDVEWNSWIWFNCIKPSQYFPKPYEPFGGNINVKVDLPNYTREFNLKNSTGIDKSKLDANMIQSV